jgi:transcriptional regulator with XRE-family HTH domain
MVASGHTVVFGADILRSMDGIAARITEILRRNGWSAAELNRRSGLASPTHVATIIRRGGAGAATDTLRKIAEGAGVSVSWLTTGEGSPELREDPPATELRVVLDGEARPSIGTQPNAEALAREIIEENPSLGPYVELVLKSGSMRSLDIPLTRSALETLARVVQSHGQRRGR